MILKKYNINDIHFELQFSHIPNEKNIVLWSLSIFRMEKNYRNFGLYFKELLKTINLFEELKSCYNNMYMVIFYDNSLTTTQSKMTKINENNKETVIQFLETVLESMGLFIKFYNQ